MDANNVQHIISGIFGDYLRQVLGDEPKRYEEAEEWLQRFIRTSALFQFEGDRYFLQPTGLSLH